MSISKEVEDTCRRIRALLAPSAELDKHRLLAFLQMSASAGRRLVVGLPVKLMIR
jgi:hypothetical protein